MSRLSPLQVRSLIIEGRKAFDYLGKQAVARGEAWDGSKEAFDQFRHHEVFAACGKHGLSQATNDDFNKIKARFLTLRGEHGESMDALLDAQSEPRRQAEAALVVAMERAGIGPAYVQKISKSKYKCAVESATVQQIHKLIMDVKARGRAKARRALQSQI